MTEPAELTGELGASRLALLDVLKRVPDDAWAPQAWGVREVVAHIAAWDEVSVQAVEAAGNGATAPEVVRDEDAFNAAAVAEFAALSAVQVVVRLHAARARLVATVSRAGDLTEVQFPWGPKGALSKMILGLVGHEREHTAELAALIEAERDSRRL